VNPPREQARYRATRWLMRATLPFARRANLPHSALLILPPNQIYIPRCPASTEGRFAIVTNVRRDAMDARCAADESAYLADGEVVWS